MSEYNLLSYHRCPVYIHMRGTASDVSGIFSVTMFRNTVSESSIVTPEIEECVASVERFMDAGGFKIKKKKIIFL